MLGTLAASRFIEMMHYLKKAAPEGLALAGMIAASIGLIHIMTGIPCWQVPGAVCVMIQVML